MNRPDPRRSPAEDPTPPSPRRLVLGLGNDVCGDDAVGLLVVRALASGSGAPVPPPGTEFREAVGAGLDLLDELPGFDDALLVDAVVTRRAPPGTLHVLTDHDLPRITLGSPHALGVGEALALGRALGLPMPARVVVAAVEVEDPYTLREGLSPALARRLPHLIRRIAALVPALPTVPVPAPESPNPAPPCLTR